MSSDPQILSVGDTAIVERLGECKVTRLDVCLQPTADPAGERHFANVKALELGEHGPMFVAGLEGGGWAYGIEVKGVVDA
jgi:hypothetical protein